MEVVYGKLVFNALHESGVGWDVSATVCQFLPPHWEIFIDKKMVKLSDPSTGRVIDDIWFSSTLPKNRRAALIRALRGCDELYKGFDEIGVHKVLNMTINIPIMGFHGDDIFDVLPFCAVFYMKDIKGFHGEKLKNVIRHIEVGLYGKDSGVIGMRWYPIFFVPKPERDKIIKAIMAQLPENNVALVGW